MMKTLTRAIVGGALLSAGVTGCVSPDLPLIPDGGASTSTSASGGGGGTGGGGMGGGTSSSTGGGGVVTTYNDMTNAAFWSTFDTTSVSANARGFGGTTFDGRYVYLVPDRTDTALGTATRYDTQASFGSAASWSTFDITSVNVNAKGFTGAHSDGRYVYFTPFHNGDYHGIVARYDTQASFGSVASWSTFTTTSVHPNARGFTANVFDGRFLYFIPYGYGGYEGVVTRYDTQASFTAEGSWSTFAPSAVAGGARFGGGVFDGRFIYLVGDVIARYDTQASFATPGSWTIFDVTGVDPSARGFVKAAFDGRYLYLVPLYDGSKEVGVSARYDTQASFTATGSWSTFDMTTVHAKAKGFTAPSFDGRYVYYLPNGYSQLSGVIARYDTQGAFTAKGSWSAFDIASVDAGAIGFSGGAFDGRYLYLVPFSNAAGIYSGLVARFDAKSPASLPSLPGWNGSW